MVAQQATSLGHHLHRQILSLGILQPMFEGMIQCLCVVIYECGITNTTRCL